MRESFGTRHLGALTGIITMVHQIFGGIGAYAGALVFDHSGSDALSSPLVASAVGLVLALMLRAEAPGYFFCIRAIQSLNLARSSVRNLRVVSSVSLPSANFAGALPMNTSGRRG